MSQNNLPVEQEIISSLVINGDFSKLSQQHKLEYYKGFCERLGLDPFTQPFKILRMNGKEVLYCDRSGAQQLNKKHNVSHEVKAREMMGDIYIVTCRASLPDGRYTDSLGAVSCIGLSGEPLANSMMKAETKAKRRATLDLLGLGILDEIETGTIPGATELPVYDCDQLKTQYLEMLTQLEQLTGTVDNKLFPDNWSKEQNVDNFLKAIQYVGKILDDEKGMRLPLQTPQTVDEINKAVRRAADKDDFYERKKSK